MLHIHQLSVARGLSINSTNGYRLSPLVLQCVPPFRLTYRFFYIVFPKRDPSPMNTVRSGTYRGPSVESWNSFIPGMALCYVLIMSLSPQTQNTF